MAGLRAAGYSSTLLLSVFRVPGTVLGPEIIEMNVAGSVRALSEVHCFCVSLEKPANLSEPMSLPSEQRPEGHLVGSVGSVCDS